MKNTAVKFIVMNDGKPFRGIEDKFDTEEQAEAAIDEKFGGMKDLMGSAPVLTITKVYISLEDYKREQSRKKKK